MKSLVYWILDVAERWKDGAPIGDLRISGFEDFRI
jgi:hypothetical protein